MTIEEYLSGDITYDEEGQVILAVKSPCGSSNLICEIRGWGKIQYEFMKEGKIDTEAASRFQDDIGRFVTEAIKEKLAKEQKEHNTFAWVHKRGE